MTEAVERPAWRISFRLLVSVALGLAFVAFMAGRHIYQTYGGYRPMALAHVPPTMRYRARVELRDTARFDALAPLFNALDPRRVRLPALEKKLGVSWREAAHELALGVGPEPLDFVLVLGLQPQAGTGLSPAKALCEVLVADGIRPEPSQPEHDGCVLAEGLFVSGTPDGALVVASRRELVKGFLGRPDIGDRLGFSGPSVRGVAPDPAELGREASTFAQRLGAKYP